MLRDLEEPLQYEILLWSNPDEGTVIASGSSSESKRR